MPNQIETKPLSDHNVKRARHAIINQMARELNFSSQDLKAVAEVIAERDAMQRKYRETIGEIARKTLNQLS